MFLGLFIDDKLNWKIHISNKIKTPSYPLLSIVILSLIHSYP